MHTAAHLGQRSRLCTFQTTQVRPLHTLCRRQRRCVQPTCGSGSWWQRDTSVDIQHTTSLFLCSAAAAAAVLAGAVDSAEAADSPLRNVKRRSDAQVDALRAEGRFRRAYDGHIAVQKTNGDWFDVRLDPENEGVVLLRDKSGTVYFLGYEFKQIDLSDDEMVRDMFHDKSWEEDLEKLDYIDENGARIKSISEDDFYEWWRWGTDVNEDSIPSRVSKE